MCEGDVTNGGKVVRCPWHNWAFDLATGTHCYDPNEKIRTYEVKVDGDQVILYA
jgi:nitrite reductase/ring-hydroxylating ferredoxin subunit